jgi:hypothetical protein
VYHGVIGRVWTRRQNVEIMSMNMQRMMDGPEVIYDEYHTFIVVQFDRWNGCCFFFPLAKAV